MANVINGTATGKVTKVSLEAVGAKQIPIIELHFDIDKVLKGHTYSDIVSVHAKKTLWLTPTPASSGKFAGKSGLEIARSQLLEVFGYDGGLDEIELNGSLVGREAKLTCEPKEYKGNQYTDIKYMNSIKEGYMGKEKKAIDASTLAKLESAWSGKPVQAKSSDSIWGSGD